MGEDTMPAEARDRVKERAVNILRQGAAQLEARAICPADTRMAQAMRTNADALAAIRSGETLLPDAKGWQPIEMSQDVEGLGKPGWDVDGICNDHGRYLCPACALPDAPAAEVGHG